MRKNPKQTAGKSRKLKANKLKRCRSYRGTSITILGMVGNEKRTTHCGLIQLTSFIVAKEAKQRRQL